MGEWLVSGGWSWASAIAVTVLVVAAARIDVREHRIPNALVLSGIVIALLLVFSIMYSFLPNRRPKRWIPITRGAVVAIAIWLLLSVGFQTYVKVFNSYTVTYGSLAAVIVLLLWLYLSAIVVLIGAAIDELHIERLARK